MVNVYKKINKFASVIAYFSTKTWKFSNDNVQALWDELPEVDKKVFPFTMRDVDWDDFFRTQILGLRVFFVKDDLSTLPQARKKWQR